MLFLRFVVQIAIAGAFYTALAIGPAWWITGSIGWFRGWLAIGILWGTQLIGGLWFIKNDPGLMRERMSPRENSLPDKLATSVIAVLMLAWLSGNAVDVHYLQLLPLPPKSLSLVGGLALFAVGMSIVVWTLRTNSFAASVVKVQEERGQRVIDKGPYAIVRHPMYAALIPLLGGLSLVMESSAIAIGVLPMVALGFLPRMLTEEATLRRELPDYDLYLARIRWRLVPGII